MGHSRQTRISPNYIEFPRIGEHGVDRSAHEGDRSDRGNGDKRQDECVFGQSLAALSPRDQMPDCAQSHSAVHLNLSARQIRDAPECRRGESVADIGSPYSPSTRRRPASCSVR